MQIGYARVSTDDQDTALQVAALKSAGCERIYKEKASGGRWDRPELIDYSTNFARVMCSWSGNSIGFLAHSVTY
jgi:Resolvase, N terminal domain